MEPSPALREKAEQQHRLVQRALVAEAIADELEKSLKPRGHFNIPPLLDERRLEYGIPNGAFDAFPAFDKVYVYQLTVNERRTYAEGGAVLMPDAVVSVDRNRAPRGIIVSAGLAALDSLRSSGIDLGHIIRFKKLSPFIQPVANIKGHQLDIMVIRDGDIVSSEDLATEYHARRLSISNVSDKGSYDHRFTRATADGALETTGAKVAAYYDPSV